MKKPNLKKVLVYKNKKLIKKYIKILLNLDKRIKNRNEFLKRHLPILLQPSTKEYQDINTRVTSVIEKTNIIPSICLASSLGFNKNSWSKQVESVMNEFGLSKKPKYFTLRNVLAFEKLKLLVLKLVEKEKKEKR
ncbi:hypothetical protein TUBRATIS_12060 [Tubulinosema ratisbonensis]|uniref:Uncharacterized protein n=1 Tax=Tubulinosema ratisbonensis TaxID=291195 RepID=A0A437AMU1_9MICR|nr:hypothetical protein TUBRATIS_12060 [Tubulinosema ratisbonensis]